MNAKETRQYVMGLKKGHIATTQGEVTPAIPAKLRIWRKYGGTTNVMIAVDEVSAQMNNVNCFMLRLAFFLVKRKSFD